MSDEAQAKRWLLLIHQLPPAPAYVRVKVGRRLAKLGAVALKNTVYVLPLSEASIEDFQWVRREIIADRGEATVLTGQLVEGLTDAQVEALFREARDHDYDVLAREVQSHARGKVPVKAAARAKLEGAIGEFDRRLAELGAIDFFKAGKRAAVVRQLEALRRTLGAPAVSAPVESVKLYAGRTWVTRTGVQVDRLASAWLIRTYIDAKATFKFVPGQGSTPLAGELRFDMYDAEFTHEGQDCTFEVLLRRFGLQDPGLLALGEIIHDLDLKDSRFGRPENAGVAAQVNGLVLRHPADEQRLVHGFELFDQLVLSLRKKAP